MNKSAIQKFAIQARIDLKEQVAQRCYQYGITKDSYGVENAETVMGRALTPVEQEQRWQLIQEIKKKGYDQIIEEVAYTWFNRFIALRFMEVNNYLPSHVRVFSDSTGAFKPEILSDVLHLDLPGLDMAKVTEYVEKNQTEDLYRYLLLTQCNALNESLPRMFEKMGGFTELLLPNNILRPDSVLGRMVSDIPEEDWTDQVQIIGWLYQYYNAELKDETFALLKKNVKITKERIPSATQLFTPDWIVRYMVENSLGRIFIDKRKNEGIYADGRDPEEMTWEEAEAKRIANEEHIAGEMGWKYYLAEAEQTREVRKQLDEIQKEYADLQPQDIKVIDPCMGSGHILVYAFDVLVQIYKSSGYSERDAAKLILENNLYGLDIDDRAAQLAYFAVMMKARQYDRRIFSRGVQPNVFAIQESNNINRRHLKFFGWQMNDLERNLALNQLNAVLDEFNDAKEYGSILNISKQDWELLYRFVLSVDYSGQMTLEAMGLEDTRDKLVELVMIATFMAQKYDVVVTNPPYMGSDSMGSKLKDFVTKFYYDLRYDIYAVFINKCLSMKKVNGLVSMITQNSFLFALCFDRLRDELIHTTNIVNAVHLGPRAFEEISGEVVQTIATVFSKRISQRKSRFVRLVEFTENKEEYFFTTRPYDVDCSYFTLLPNSVFAYSLSNAMKTLCMEAPKIGCKFISKAGVVTGKDDYFLRHWYEPIFTEIDLNAINTSSKYVPFSKGGSFVKWYGNITYALKLADLWNDGKVNKSVRRGDRTAYFQRCIGWSYMGGGNDKNFSTLQHCVCGTGTPTILATDESIYYYTLGFLNTKIPQKFIELFNPTLNTYASDICNLPYVDMHDKSTVIATVKQCIEKAKMDWDSVETSWDFKKHPLV